MDLPRLDHQVHRAIHRAGVQSLAGAVQRGDGAAEDLFRVGFGFVVGFHRLADIDRAAGDALRQLDLHLRVAAHAQGTAEAIDGGLTDLGRLGQGRDGVARGLPGILQDDLGDLAFRAVEFADAVLDGLQQGAGTIHENS